MNRGLTLLLAGLLLVVNPALAEQTVDAPATVTESGEIRISSERLEAEEQSRRVRFVGEVVARHRDVVIYAEELVLIYSEDRQFDQVEALRAVRVVQGERLATGDKAVYYSNEGRIVLSGDAQVRQGDNLVQGEEITVFLDSEKTIVTGGDQSRVRAVIRPGDQP